MIFGGLGDDFLHGGSGDDAISGAEALVDVLRPERRRRRPSPGSDLTRPFNDGNLLGFSDAARRVRASTTSTTRGARSR